MYNIANPVTLFFCDAGNKELRWGAVLLDLGRDWLGTLGMKYSVILNDGSFCKQAWFSLFEAKEPHKHKCIIVSLYDSAAGEWFRTSEAGSL